MIEFFIVPIEAAGGPGLGAFSVKYQHDPAVSSYGSMRYSWGSCAVLMLNATQTYLDSVAAQPDVYKVCAAPDLLENIGGQATVALRNWLEGWGIPGNWISAADSYRQVLRGILGMFLFAHRHEYLNKKGFFQDLEEQGFDLNTRWEDLSQSFRDTILAQITEKEWPIAPAANDQVRKLLKDFSDKYDGTRIVICNVEI